MILSTEADAICESAARVLFMNIRWARNMPAFATLSLPDRLLLLVDSWKDLFVLGSVQFLYPLNLRLLIDPENSSADLSRGVDLFQKALSDISETRPDSNEFSCLRSLMVFKTSLEDLENAGHTAVNGPRRLQDIAAVAALKDYSQAILCEVRVYTI